jgi:general stress protein YciG
VQVEGHEARSWAKIDDRANEHPKLLEAGPKAAWLWVCGLMWANRQSRKTGRIPKLAVGMLFHGVGPKEAKRLVDVGLWHDTGKEYEIHDYHPWNPELREKRAEAGRKGGKASGESRREANHEANGKQLASVTEANTEACERSNSAGARVTRVDPPPPPPPQEENPPNPPSASRDPLAASLTGRQPHDRVDVNKLHEAYKRTFDLPHRTWFPGNLHEARIMAEAIDAHGLDKCLLVLAEAPNDGMVSGRDDEKKAKHESVSYIFGNSSAFDRMLRAAAKRVEATGNGKSITETMAALKDRRVS